MKNSILVLLLTCLFAMSSFAQQVSVRWELSEPANLSAAVVTGNSTYTAMLTTNYLAGSSVVNPTVMTGSNADQGYQSVTYTPTFTQFYVKTRTSSKTQGHNIAFAVKPQSGHTFKPTKISFDAAKCGTDGGNFDVVVKTNATGEQALATAISPLRNKISSSNSTGFSHHEFILSDYIVEDENFVLSLYLYNINGTDTEAPKAIAFRNVIIEGVVDEPVYTADHYIRAFTFKTPEGKITSLTSLIKGVKNGGVVSYPEKLKGDPNTFKPSPYDGYTAEVEYKDKTAYVTVIQEGAVVFSFEVRFTISGRQPRPDAKPLGRGLISVNLGNSGGSGNLVSWRYREADAGKVKFKLFRGTSATVQNTKVNNGNYIYSCTNFKDGAGSTSAYYRLEVYDLDDNLIESVVSGKTWNNQSFTIPIGNGPTDPHGEGATYTPNDASFCDMDGDGEYEIILKWSPSNEKDAASSGTTSDVFFDCIKMDGTRLWRIDMGPNFFASAHTIQFIAWDFDGDGYGEFMVKTAPGTIDGQGNYVLLGKDSPTENLLSSRGKQDHGSEYITVFDGLTGAEISTIPYHTDYAAGLSYWGDSNQNRSERYLAALAYLDGYDKNPSPIFARGYYSGAFVGAYDFDGETLKERWVSRNITSGKGLWGEGAHWISVGDVDDDGKQEIIYGSACLDHDGKLLYRTGMGHGDALHLSDFDPDHEGLEVFMPHEHKPYGVDFRDAKSGKVMLRQEEGGDTGRGLAAHFDYTRPDAQFLTSARAQMYNCHDGSVNTEKWAIGSSGAGINCRIYWDGDLYDEFFDKSIIGKYNPSNKGFDRVQFNGGNYMWGNLNNGSKNNPCVLGDILGDWREEIVTWTGDAANGFSLYINTTNQTSNVRMPHLMDDPQYRVQIVNQNCCYNQPPHLGYDPATEHTVKVTIPENGYLPMMAQVALQIPSDVKVYYVANFDTNVDTLKMTSIKSNIPANTACILYGKAGQQVTLRPSGGAEPANLSGNKLIGDAFIPTQIESSETVSYYMWDDRDGIGYGYFKVDAATVPAGVPYLKATSSASRVKDYFLIGKSYTDVIEAVKAVDVKVADENYYLLDGRKSSERPAHGVFVKNGKKQVAK